MWGEKNAYSASISHLMYQPPVVLSSVLWPAGYKEGEPMGHQSWSLWEKEALLMRSVK